ncbi:hypothetical protein [Nitrospira japonica]|nr:hypothetical protein [Nitrospira japonica]
MKKAFLILLGLSVLTLTGCQTQNHVKDGEGTSFSALWKTYSHCNTGDTLDQMSHDAQILRTAASHSRSLDGFVIPLPIKIERLVSAPSARLAVDVKAMAASCSLRAGQAAAQVGHIEMARSLFESVLEYRPQAEYAYYSLQAKAALLNLDNPAITVSLHH